MTGNTESWQPSNADESYVSRMRQLWTESWQRPVEDIDMVEYLNALVDHNPLTTAVIPGPPLVQQSLNASTYTIVAARPGVDQKPTGNSTGLGLPLSRALAKAAGGWIGLADSLGAGCTSPAKPATTSTSWFRSKRASKDYRKSTADGCGRPSSAACAVSAATGSSQRPGPSPRVGGATAVRTNDTAHCVELESAEACGSGSYSGENGGAGAAFSSRVDVDTVDVPCQRSHTTWYWCVVEAPPVEGSVAGSTVSGRHSKCDSTRRSRQDVTVSPIVGEYIACARLVVLHCAGSY